jgi:hypothetical protein
MTSPPRCGEARAWHGVPLTPPPRRSFTASGLLGKQGSQPAAAELAWSRRSGSRRSGSRRSGSRRSGSRLPGPRLPGPRLLDRGSQDQTRAAKTRRARPRTRAIAGTGAWATSPRQCAGASLLRPVCWGLCAGVCVLGSVCWGLCAGVCVLGSVCWGRCAGVWRRTMPGTRVHRRRSATSAAGKLIGPRDLLPQDQEPRRSGQELRPGIEARN